MRGALVRAARFGLALALVGGVALAQDPAANRTKRPQPPSAQTASTPAVDADKSVAASAAQTEIPPTNPIGPAPPLPLRGPQGLATSGATPVLRSAVRSRWSAPARIASRGESACRLQCSTARIACVAAAVEDVVSHCDADWTRCISTCDGFGYARAPSPGP